MESGEENRHAEPIRTRAIGDGGWHYPRSWPAWILENASMRSIGRNISLLLRRIDSARDERRVRRNFAGWGEVLKDLPGPDPRNKKLLLIRLDDIGDYLLFRNQLAMYRKSQRWKDYEITLLGNDSWKQLFTVFDRDNVDDTMWVNKHRYLGIAGYRRHIWEELRGRGFETAIAPSHVRPLVLDDLCVMAAGATYNLGCANNNIHEEWNRLSDRLYTSLFQPSRALMHEFDFNADFTLWACGIRFAGRRPEIHHQFSAPVQSPYIICFVGASTRSKRWPSNRWIEFIKRYRSRHAHEVYLAGNSANEVDMARAIQRATHAKSLVGTVSQVELLRWIGFAETVVTNDTMAAHLGVSLNRPTVIVANGLNYMRFSEFRNAGIDNVATIYPEVVNRRRRRLGEGLYPYHKTVSADIASIPAAAVIAAVDALSNAERPSKPVSLRPPWAQ